MAERDPGLDLLIEVIADRRAAILARWQKRARAQLPTDELAPPSVRDHLPDVLDELRELLEEPGGGADRSAARQHRAHRLVRGFDLRRVIAEYDLLRACVVEEWQDAAGGREHSAEVCQRLQGAVGRLILRATDRDLRERAHATESLQRSLLETRVRQQSELAALGLRALQATRLQTVFEDAAATASRMLGTELAKVLELSGDRQELVLRAGVGWRPGMVGRATVSVGVGSQAGFTLLSRHPVVVRDLRTETRFQGPPLLTEHGVVSGISATIEAPGPGGEPFGILGTHTRSLREFGDEDATLVQAIANIVGASILRVRSEERAAAERERADRHAFLAQVSAALSGSLDYEATVAQIAQVCVEALADCCIIDALVDDDHIRKFRVAHRDPGRHHVIEALQALRLDRREPHLAAEVLRSRRPLLIPEVTSEQLDAMSQSDRHRQLLRALHPTSLMILPLLIEQRPIGALILLSEARRFGREDLRLGEELARRAALAVKGALLYAEAQEAVRVRDQVLGVVAHDLRNPLNIISVAASNLFKLLPAADDRRARKALAAIQRSAGRASHLIHDLLEVARMEAGQLRLRRTPLQAGRLVAEAAESFAPVAADAGIDLKAVIGPGLPPIYGDADRLHQVLANLVDNAMKVTPADGRIRIGVEAGEGEVRFFVSDTGPGIEEAHLPKVFARFWSAPDSGRAGAGLGLSIARGIVESHGGRIWLTSQPGRGTTVCFSVPVARGGVASASPGAGPPP